MTDEHGRDPEPFDGLLDDGVDELLRLAAAGLDATCWAATERIFNEVPAYAHSGDPQLRQQVAYHVRAIMQAFLDCVQARRWATEKDFLVTAPNALNRVSQGISIADYLRAFRLAQVEFWRSLVATAQNNNLDRTVLVGVATLLMQLFEIGGSVAARSYSEAEQYRIANQERVRRDLIEDLLAGRDPTIEPRRALLHAVGLHHDGEFVVASVQTVSSRAEDELTATLLRSKLIRLESSGRGLIVPRHREIVAVLPANRSSCTGLVDRFRETRDALVATGVDVAIGISRLHRGWADIADAHRESRVARNGVGRAGGVLCLATMSVLDFFVATRSPTALRLIDPRIRTFVEEELAGDGTFLDTLEAYVDSGLNAKTAADRLHLHVNTAYYRLERITERTGIDLRQLPDVLNLMVAVRMLQHSRNT